MKRCLGDTLAQAGFIFVSMKGTLPKTPKHPPRSPGSREEVSLCQYLLKADTVLPHQITIGADHALGAVVRVLPFLFCGEVLTCFHVYFTSVNSPVADSMMKPRTVASDGGGHCREVLQPFAGTDVLFEHVHLRNQAVMPKQRWQGWV